MNTNSSDVDNNQSAAIYVNKKGINELFEVEILRREITLIYYYFLF